jgi:hypothetical protein
VSAPRSRSLETTRRTSKRASGKQTRSRTRRPRLESLEDRCLLAVSPGLLTTIEGLNSSDGLYNIGGDDAAPPDPHGAVGPTHVVNVANRSIQWFTKEGIRHGHTSLANFFQPLRPLTPPLNPSAVIYDPRVLYDQFAERFVVLAVERSSDAIFTSRFMMAVSDDSDPNGTWYYQSINAQTNIVSPDDPLEILPHYADFPGMAVSSEAVFITANMLSFDDDEANGSQLWIVDKGLGKGGFYENGRAAWTRHDPGTITQVDYSVNQDNAIRLRSMYPAHIYGTAPAGVGTWLVMYDGRTDLINEFVDVIRVDNPLTNPTFRLFSVNVGDLEPIIDPFTPFDLAPVPEAPQPLLNTTISVLDRRVYDAVWRDGNLYFTTVIVPEEGPDANQTTAHWFRMNTTNPLNMTLADQGPIGGEEIAFSSYTAFPSIAVDAQGNMAVSYALFGPGIFPSAFYSLRAATDPPGTLRDAVALAEGFDAYELEDPNQELVAWGRSSGLAIDPADSVTFWTFNTYSLPRFDEDGRWGSRWGSFRLAGLPDLPPPGPTTISGVKWHDLDDDGFRDSDEPAISNTLIYVDYDGDGQLDLTEPTARTNARGEYSITIDRAGPVIIREVIPPGWEQTFPGGPDFAHTINIPASGGGTITGINFGNSDSQGFDWGNAPEPYPTLRVDNGARHPILAGYGLGALVVGTPDGEPNADAAAIDNDGVVLPGSVGPGQSFTIRVTNTGTGLLQGWIDWNGDGDWNDPGEQIFQNVSLTAGTHTFSRTAPASASPGTTFARFRYGKEGGLSPTGASSREGEVEDYRIDILSPQPIAVDDFFTVEQNSQNNVFLVMANDIPGSSGRANLRLSDISAAGSSGTVVIDDNNTPDNLTDDFIRYSPAPGAFAPDAFTYTITDTRTGLSDAATVAITILESPGNVPVAIDDSYIFTPQTVGGSFMDLNVLANDRRGPTGSITIPANGIDSTGTFGSVQVITANNQQVVRYSPNGFAGADQFRYTIVDGNNVTSTATVTIRTAPHTQDDIVKFRLVLTDTAGRELPKNVRGNYEIGQGLEFQLRAYVDDLRGEPGRPPLSNPEFPVASAAQQGVFSAYMDLLYEAGYVAYSGDNRLIFGPEYNQGKFVDSSIPGILDEIGALQSSTTPLGPDEQLLYAATFTAVAKTLPGQPTFFKADPADVLPLHETSVNFPEKAVPYPRIDFGVASVEVVDAPKLVQIELVATTLNGTVLEKDDTIQAGTEFFVSAYVQDIRTDVADPLKGVFSAYLDVFFPRFLTTPVASDTSPFGFNIAFSPPFTEGQKAEFITNIGQINEVGAFRSSAPNLPNTPQPQLLFTTRFRALSPAGGFGQIAFTADPADSQPINEVSLIRSGSGQVPDPGLSVPTAQVEYISTPSFTVIGAAGEGEFTNPNNPLDVNNDGFVTPTDALYVMNFLNTIGPFDLRTILSGAAEGEAADVYYYDTNADKIVSTQDLMPIINYLNLAAATGSQTGQAEGEAWTPQASEIVALTVDPPAVSAMIALADAPTARAALTKLGFVSTAAEENYFPAPDQDDDQELADLDLWLADDMVEDIAAAWQDPASAFEPLDLIA